ncbi:MAG: thiol:disulfide interchange protein DsbA/DsbL [Pseudomonadota bacterium]
MSLQIIPRLAALALLFFPLLACAEAATEDKYKQGEHYSLLDSPVKTRNSKKVEVVEVFWYGCSHCYSFEPVVQRWHEKQADDVDFWQSPAIWRDHMVVHARAFYAAQQLRKKHPGLHQAIFDAMNVNRNPLENEAAVAALFAKNDVSADAFSKAYNSFAATSGVRLADARTRNYKVTGTPELIVNGKYRVSARMAGSQQDMLDVVDFLVSKERAAAAK